MEAGSLIRTGFFIATPSTRYYQKEMYRVEDEIPRREGGMTWGGAAVLTLWARDDKRQGH